MSTSTVGRGRQRLAVMRGTWRGQAEVSRPSLETRQHILQAGSEIVFSGVNYHAVFGVSR